MKKQSQNDYYCTIAQLYKTNKFEAFDTAREQKKPSDFACEAGLLAAFLVWAPATLVMGSSFV